MSLDHINLPEEATAPIAAQSRRGTWLAVASIVAPVATAALVALTPASIPLAFPLVVCGVALVLTTQAMLRSRRLLERYPAIERLLRTMGRASAARWVDQPPEILDQIVAVRSFARARRLLGGAAAVAVVVAIACVSVKPHAVRDGATAKPGNDPTDTEEVAAGASGETSTSADNAVDAAVDREQAISFARKLARDLRRGDVEAVSPVVDNDAVVARVTRGRSLPPAIVKGFRTGLGRNPVGIVAPILGKDVRFCSYLEVDGESRLLFRHGTGTAYIELVIARRSGRIVVVDLYKPALGRSASWSSAEMLSIAIRPGLSDSQRQDFQAFVSTASASSIRHEALAIYHRLPSELHKEEWFRLARLNLALALDKGPRESKAEAGPELTLAAGRDVLALRSDYHGVELLHLAMARAGGQRDEILARISALEAIFGADDGNLAHMAARAHQRAGAIAEAEAAARRGIAVEPSFEDNWWLLLDLLAERGDFDRLASLLTEMEDQLGKEQVATVQHTPSLARFAASAQGRAWLAARRPRDR